MQMLDRLKSVGMGFKYFLLGFIGSLDCDWAEAALASADHCQQ